MDSHSLSQTLIDLTNEFSAHNYGPLEIVARSAEGVWVTDVEGKRYIDFLSAYSALNFGHRNARIAEAAHKQIDQLTLICRAFYAEEMAYACRDLAQLCRKDKVLLMNAGAEAVETAIKCARKWGRDVKGLSDGEAEIICLEDNFHGRTSTIISFSTSSESKDGFGPFASGFKIVPFGDASAIEQAITPKTVAVLLEPALGEGGYIFPPFGYLQEVRAICSKHNVLMIADEIQTGLCRTGEIFACDLENVIRDIFILGKSLGGGILPVSAIAADDDIMKVFTPGIHGSTFGGNPLASAILREVVALINEEKPHKNAQKMGELFSQKFCSLKFEAIDEIRVKGLMIGIDINPAFGPAKNFCKKLKYEGVLTKDTRAQTIRIAPPLFITEEELDWGIAKLIKVFSEAGRIEV